MKPDKAEPGHLKQGGTIIHSKKLHSYDRAVSAKRFNKAAKAEKPIELNWVRKS